jgi:two-component system nitrogen regulation sensor histidine kinase NtrY
MKIFKPILTIVMIICLVAIVGAIEIYFMKLPSVDITTRFILISLMAFNIIALITLMFFVGKNIYRLYIERQQKILGYKFKTKLVTIFVILTLLPSGFLFAAASGLATNYINRIFSPQMKAPFTKSVELARDFYDFERRHALETARYAANIGTTSKIPGYKIMRYKKLPNDAPEIISEAFKGKENTEILSKETGDVIRAAVPDNHGNIVVAEAILPKSIGLKSEELIGLYEDFIKLESLKTPLRLNYMLILGFITLMIVFAGIWVSLKLSRGITIPIQSLAAATSQIASGNLNVRVKEKSEDEIGLLINSFNQMVSQLKENKDSLENAYRELDRRRLYLENTLENITSGVLCIDNNGNIQTVNKAACAILQKNRGEIVGTHWRHLIMSLNSEELASMVSGLEGKQINEVKREIKINISGQALSLRIYITAIRETITAKAMGMLVVFEDLTEVIKAQKAITWQEVSKRIAHEIKNPLTPIKLSTERLIKKWQKKDEQFDSVFEKSTKTIISEVESLKRLVDVFAKYGKMPEITKEPVNVAEIIEDVASLYRGFKDIAINVTIADDITYAQVDKEQFKRVIINIVDNAINAMESSGTINIDAHIKENILIINIADNGQGIADDEKEKLFIPYFSKTKGGTGLGLAISSRIIADHGGRITIKDNIPKGSIFTIEVPV